MQSLVRPGSQAEQVGRLVLAGVVAVSLPQLPLGNFLIYPFTILTTWFHEMGHGIAALLLGWDFERLVILADGSGVAESFAPGGGSPLARALVSMGGPLGPSVIGALLILATRKARHWKPALIALASAIALSVLVWVRSPTGLVVLPLVAAALGAITWKASAGVQRFTLQFLGILAALSMFRDWDYLFSHSAVIGGQPMLSDTGAIEEALWLPYWLWAGLIVLASGAMVGASLRYALSEDGAAHRKW